MLGHDVILFNEMPLGTWLPTRPNYDQDAATAAIEAHREALDRWREDLGSVVLSSRPVQAGGRLINEAFAMDQASYVPAHHKRVHPEEPGFYEQTWFGPGDPGFECVVVSGMKVGFLLCTELMFTEWARWYGAIGAHIIVVPRASGGDRMLWKAAARMAAITSGCYVVSSNRVGTAEDGTTFNGCGFAIAPDGTPLAETCRANPVKAVKVDVVSVERQRREYPCYLTTAQVANPRWSWAGTFSPIG